jgi:hypothetical protein
MSMEALMEHGKNMKPRVTSCSFSKEERNMMLGLHLGIRPLPPSQAEYR